VGGTSWVAAGLPDGGGSAALRSCPTPELAGSSETVPPGAHAAPGLQGAVLRCTAQVVASVVATNGSQPTISATLTSMGYGSRLRGARLSSARASAPLSAAQPMPASGFSTKPKQQGVPLMMSTMAQEMFERSQVQAAKSSPQFEQRRLHAHMLPAAVVGSYPRPSTHSPCTPSLSQAMLIASVPDRWGPQPLAQPPPVQLQVGPVGGFADQSQKGHAVAMRYSVAPCQAQRQASTGNGLTRLQKRVPADSGDAAARHLQTPTDVPPVRGATRPVLTPLPRTHAQATQRASAIMQNASQRASSAPGVQPGYIGGGRGAAVSQISQGQGELLQHWQCLSPPAVQAARPAPLSYSVRSGNCAQMHLAGAMCAKVAFPHAESNRDERSKCEAHTAPRRNCPWAPSSAGGRLVHGEPCRGAAHLQPDVERKLRSSMQRWPSLHREGAQPPPVQPGVLHVRPHDPGGPLLPVDTSRPSHSSSAYPERPNRCTWSEQRTTALCNWRIQSPAVAASSWLGQREGFSGTGQLGSTHVLQSASSDKHAGLGERPQAGRARPAARDQRSASMGAPISKSAMLPVGSTQQHALDR
jgi:hypothetical protein